MIDERTDIGARLRSARQGRGISLRQIADATKLSVSTLEALERGNVSRLPGGIYRRAIVRAFAREVGLAPEETLEAFLAQHPDDLPPPGSPKALEAIVDTSDSRTPRRGLLQMAVKLLGASVPVIAGVYYFSGHTPPPVARKPTDNALPSRPIDVWRPEIVPAGGFSEAPPPAVHPVVVRLTISSACVLRVTADGRIIVARAMSPGEQLEVALSDELLLSGDDAGAVQFSINGQAGRLLGAARDPLDVRIGRDDYERWLVSHR
jgi:cytoskeleton protein RodZ